MYIGRRFVRWFLLVAQVQLQAAVIIPGDISDTIPQQSFSFPIKPFVYHRADGILFVGAHQATSGTAAPFALASIAPQETSFRPLLTTDTIVVNGTPAQPNVLKGAKMTQLSLLSRHPVLVHETEPSFVYVLHQFDATASTFFRVQMLDAQAQPTAGMVALTTNTYAADIGDLQANMAIFAAVKKQGGLFGQVGSGVAVAGFVNDAQGALQLQYVGTTPLDITTPEVKIGGDLAAMADAATLHSENFFKMQHIPRVAYIGLQVTAGAGMDDGAEGVIAFEGTMGLPFFAKLAPDSAVTSDSIVAAKGPGSQVSIYHIGTMHTTTMLSYLVVVGGVGAPTATQKKVFALPLNQIGLLANKNAEPVTQFLDDAPFYVQRRYFDTPATKPGDLYTSTDLPAMVGAGDAPGPITSLYVSGDAVFVATAASSAGQQPGIWHSQALFDELGRIKGWTQWRRVGGATDPVWTAVIDEHSGNAVYLTGPTQDTIQTVKRTQWLPGQRGAAMLMHNQFAQKNGGLQGLVDFPAATFGFNQATPLAVTAATGTDRVLLVQSGQTVDGLFGPTQDVTPGFTSTDGSLGGLTPGVRWLSMSGGAVATLGPIVTAAVVTDGTHGWFVVGGAHGVAILARPDGTGWPLVSGLQDGFVGLDASMRWQQLGQFQAVRKVVSQNGLLYVLTDQTLQRVNVNPQTVLLGSSAVGVVLAQARLLPAGFNSFLSDVLISQKVALLATSSGLLRAGDGTDITTALSSDMMRWTSVPVPESAGPFTRFFALSSTGIETDVAQLAPAVSGNIYALNGYVGLHQGLVYRFTIQYEGTVTDRTVQPLPDLLVQGQQSTFFLNAGNYYNYLTTDGSIFAVSRSRYLGRPTFLDVLAPSWMARVFRVPFNQAIRVIDEPQAHHIGQMIRASASGAWMVPGEFGLIANE